MSKAHSTLRQLYRDWSAEGYNAEVKPLLDLILSQLSTHLPLPANSSAEPPTLLLPGAGLARLLLALTLSGYNAEGNEISYHQLLASNFILNGLLPSKTYALYPFCTTFTNHTSRSNQLRSYTIPDVHPSTAMAEATTSGKRVGSMNMSAGDFITSYSSLSNKSQFDGVVTVYFIDTAPNLIRYIETVKHCLRDGGVWINIGPLLWHFDDLRLREHNREHHAQSQTNTQNLQPQTTDEDEGIAEPGSFELSDDEVVHLVEKLGFKVEKHEVIQDGSGGGYIQDPSSMLQNTYRCSHWVARKVV